MNKYGAPDFHHVTIIKYEAYPPEVEPRIIPRPMGAIKRSGETAATSADWAKIVGYVVPKGKEFHLAKIVLSCEHATWFRIMWDTTQLGITYLLPLKFTLPDWFPWDWNPLVGDGAKELKIDAKYYTTSGWAAAELVGEETKT